MTNIPINATGWSELMDGHMINAVYVMFDTAFGSMGIVVVILFFVYQLMLYLKTENIALAWTTGIFFTSLYAASIYVEEFSVQFIFLLLVLEFAGTLYLLLFNK